MSEAYRRSSTSVMKSEDLVHNRDSSQHHDDAYGEGEGRDTSIAGTVYDDGSIDGSEPGGVYAQPRSAGNVNDSLNGESSNHGSKEPRKLQRPIQRGAQACRWIHVAHT